MTRKSADSVNVGQAEARFADDVSRLVPPGTCGAAPATVTLRRWRPTCALRSRPQQCRSVGRPLQQRVSPVAERHWALPVGRARADFVALPSACHFRIICARYLASVPTPLPSSTALHRAQQSFHEDDNEIRSGYCSSGESADDSVAPSDNRFGALASCHIIPRHLVQTCVEAGCRGNERERAALPSPAGKMPHRSVRSRHALVACFDTTAGPLKSLDIAGIVTATPVQQRDGLCDSVRFSSAATCSPNSARASGA